MEVLAPIQEGANRALKPFRDLFGWFGDTLDAKDERKQAARPSATQLRNELAQADASDKRDLEQYKGLQDAERRRAASATTRPVEARVIARSPELLVPDVPDQQGLERRRRGRPAGRQQRRAGRQGQVGLRRQRLGDAAHRPRVRRLGAGARERRARQRRPRGRRARRPALRARAERQGGPSAASASSPPARAPRRRVSRPALAVPARHPDRHGQAGRDRRGRARPRDPRPAGRRPAQARHRRGADPAATTTCGRRCRDDDAAGRRPPRPARAAGRHRRAHDRLADLGLRRARRPLAAARGLGRLPLRLGPRRGVRLLPRPVRRHRAAADAGRELARLHGRRLRRRPRPRAARPGARARAGRDRRRGDRGRHDRLLAAAVPARRRGAGLAAAAAPDPDDDRAQHAARAARVRRSAAACWRRTCPTTRAAAGAARTRPAASARSRAA